MNSLRLPSEYVGSCIGKIHSLRSEMLSESLTAYVVPHADEYRNEYLAAYAERLAWLTHFTGSSGVAIVTLDKVHLFTDGRYVEQAINQLDSNQFVIHRVLDQSPEEWLRTHSAAGERIGLDPTLFTPPEICIYQAACDHSRAELVQCERNLVDKIWQDQPARPVARIFPHPLCFSGVCSQDKREALARKLTEDGINCMIPILPDSIAWLLNIRGGDMPITPLPFSRCILYDNSSVDLYVDEQKIDCDLTEHLGAEVQIHPLDEFSKKLEALGREKKTVKIDESFCPSTIVRKLQNCGADVKNGPDLCQLEKAVKNRTEIEGARKAHVHDGLALTRFLHWIATHQNIESEDELSASVKLAQLRRENPELRDLAFPSISAFGPHSALAHYLPSSSSNLQFKKDMLYLIDSGGQYPYGTTDVTRTVAIGKPTHLMKDRFTRVLKGHIKLASTTFPVGTNGVTLDVLPRLPLWEVSLDYDHGTGHGVGSYLGVHEGPCGIHFKASMPLEAGMVLTNEPGYYKAGDFGIRIENVVLVTAMPSVSKEELPMLGFETLTLAPIDRSLILPEMMNDEERHWLDSYHRKVFSVLGPLLGTNERDWLASMAEPI